MKLITLLLSYPYARAVHAMEELHTRENFRHRMAIAAVGLDTKKKGA